MRWGSAQEGAQLHRLVAAYYILISCNPCWDTEMFCCIGVVRNATGWKRCELNVILLYTNKLYIDL